MITNTVVNGLKVVIALNHMWQEIVKKAVINALMWLILVKELIVVQMEHARLENANVKMVFLEVTVKIKIR
jgi:hypothetical protein